MRKFFDQKKFLMIATFLLALIVMSSSVLCYASTSEHTKGLLSLELQSKGECLYMDIPHEKAGAIFVDQLKYKYMDSAVFEGDATFDAEWKVEDGTLVALGKQDNYIQFKPLKPGRTTLTVSYKGITLQRPVVIYDSQQLLNRETVVDIDVKIRGMEITSINGLKNAKIDLKDGRTRQIEVIATLSNGEKINVSQYAYTTFAPDYVRIWDNLKNKKNECVEDALTAEFLKPGKSVLSIAFDGKYYNINLEVVETRTHSSQFRRIFKFMYGSSVMNIGTGYLDPEVVPIDPTNNAVMPVAVNGRTMIPARALVERAGGTVEWEPNEKRVTLKYAGREIVMWLDHTTAFVNGVAYELDVPPQGIHGRTMVPLRFIGENLGFKVDWHDIGLINLIED